MEYEQVKQRFPNVRDEVVQIISGVDADKYSKLVAENEDVICTVLALFAGKHQLPKPSLQEYRIMGELLFVLAYVIGEANDNNS